MPYCSLKTFRCSMHSHCWSDTDSECRHKQTDSALLDQHHSYLSVCAPDWPSSVAQCHTAQCEVLHVPAQNIRQGPT
jgi:hypothetical protein